MQDITSFFSSMDFYPFLFGFSAYSLFAIWVRLAARWINWFPLAAKLTRFSLYGAAVGIAIFGINQITQPEPAWLSIGAGLIAAPIINNITRRLRPKEKVRRGARVADAQSVNRQVTRANAKGLKDSFNIGGITVPRDAEPYHFFVVGSTGSGKTVAITQLLDHLEARGDIALVVDSGGEFTSRYYKPERDYILNPFDSRCTPWSPTAEMAGPWDAEALAKSMIPDGVGDSKEWNAYAQTLVTSVLRQLSDQGNLSIKSLLYFVQTAPIEELEPLLKGTPAAAQLVSDKTFGSIRTIAANYLATYAYLTESDTPFSVSSFIRKEKPGFLFFTYRDDQLDSLSSMISCALDVAARTILALPPDRERRVWLIIDEFASIGKVQSIEAVATKARKVGGSLLLGLQSVSQLKDRYGEHGAQTILSCLSSWLVLRCSDADTAEYISKYIGDTEVSRMTRGESSSIQGGSDSLSEQIQTQRAVMPVELQRLANLEGFFKLAGDYPIASIKLRFPANRKNRSESYQERDFRANPMLDLNLKDEPKEQAPVAPEAPATPPQDETPPADSGGGQQASFSAPSPEASTPTASKALLAQDAAASEPTSTARTSSKGSSSVSSNATQMELGPEGLESALNGLAAEFPGEGGLGLEGGESIGLGGGGGFGRSAGF